MANYFDVRNDSTTERKAMKAYSESFLADVLPAMRLAARGCGYALAVHGSLSRDIDILAIPWIEDADSKDFLVDRLLGVIAGYVGRATRQGGWSERPHNRYSMTIIHGGHGPEIDLSVMSLNNKEKTS